MSTELTLYKGMRIKSTLIALAVFTAGAICVFVLYYVDPSASNLYSRCPFFMLTGLKCPSCGITRALHCALHGDVIGALRYNQFLVIALPLVLLLMVFPSYKNSIALCRTILVAGICWWILRNIW